MALTFHTGYLPGAIGRVAQLHADYYTRAAGFGCAFEVKVATELSQFVARLDDQRSNGADLLLLALLDGQIQASIAIDGSQAQTESAHLRWFIVSDLLRGQGVGQQLLAQALAFVDAKKYAQTTLWTFDELAAASHLYLKAGFRLVHQARGQQWGKLVNEQMYLRDGA